MRIVFALFLAAHGLVHLLYVGQALHKFEIKPGLRWPDGAWAFGWLPPDGVRWVAAIALGLVGAAFVVAGVALAFKAGWWQPIAVTAAIASSVALLLMWNGRMQSLDAQGLIAVMLNIGILVVVLWLHWPDVTV